MNSGRRGWGAVVGRFALIENSHDAGERLIGVIIVGRSRGSASQEPDGAIDSLQIVGGQRVVRVLFGEIEPPGGITPFSLEPGAIGIGFAGEAGRPGGRVGRGNSGGMDCGEEESMLCGAKRVKPMKVI